MEGPNKTNRASNKTQHIPPRPRKERIEFYYTDLYNRTFQYAQGVTTNVRVFAGAMLQIIRDHLWQRGWLDHVSHQRISTPSLKEFIERPVPKGIGQSIEWTYTALKSACDLGDEHARQAISIEGGTSKNYTLARLKRDRPDLAQRVVDGELSANAAAIEAGFRKRQSNLEKVKQLVAKLAPEERRQFADWFRANK